MKTESITFLSNDGKTNVNGVLWTPEGMEESARPRGIFQIVHGMAEYIDRYQHFAQFLTDNGFVVCGADHIGHGKSISSKDDLGHFPIGNGADVLIEDVHALRQKVASVFGPEIPYVLFGHSMGSFVVRAYITRHHDVSACVICGTGQQPQMVSKAGNALCRVLAKVKGDHHQSALVDGMAAGGYWKRLDNPRTHLDWLSIDEDNVNRYIDDPQCGFMFTVGGYAGVTKLTDLAADPKLALRVPDELPLYFIAGGLDPVGDNGKGVLAAAKQYRAAGVKTVDVNLYDGYRHEILNEEISSQVMNDIDSWLTKQGI